MPPAPAPRAVPAAELARLAEAVAAVAERRGRGAQTGGAGGAGGAGGVVRIGGGRLAPSPDHGPLLARGTLHEWFGVEGPPGGDGPQVWVPPMTLLVHAAAGALAGDGPGAGGGHAVWIGRRCWPSPHALVRRGEGSLLGRSIFIDPPDDAARLWAIDLAARCPAAGVVVADGSGLGMAATRRLQLAAGALATGGGGPLVMLARPARERGGLSAAGARWLVRTLPAEDEDDDRPGWSVELLRCKGLRPAQEGAPRRWAAAFDHDHGLVVVPAPVADRPAGETREAPGRPRGRPRLRTA